jgi:hypothetical protein
MRWLKPWPNLKLSANPSAGMTQSSQVLVDMRFRHRQQDIDVIETGAIVEAGDAFPEQPEVVTDGFSVR